MSTPNFPRMAVVAVMILSLTDPLCAKPKERDGGDHKASSYFVAPDSERAVLALWQATAQRDGRRDGASGPRGNPRGQAGRRLNRPMNERRPPFPPQVMERLRNMTPQQRERVLQNNPRFQQLPSERKAEILERLKLLLEMTPEQRRDLDQRISVFRNLSPEQKSKARQIYEKHWRVLSPNRRTAVLEEFRNLRNMSAEERERRVISDEYQMEFSPEERALLDELSSL